MKIVEEFKAFINRGNVVDLAVGVIIGAAFGKIVSSLVADVVMPLVGLVGGGVNFSSLSLTLGGTPEKPALLHYGNFIQASFDFLIVAFSIFVMVKGINALQRKKPEVAPVPTRDQELLQEIRDLLRSRAL